MNAIITCVNDRRHISPLIFECFKRLSNEFNDLALIVGYTSPEDGEMVERWASEHPRVHPVGPIKNIAGLKFDTVLKYAYQSVSEFRGFLIMGDDNSISSDFYKTVTTCFGYNYLGTNVNAYLDLATMKAMKHEYKNPNKLIGAGRFISREAIQNTCFETKIIFNRELHIAGQSYSGGMTLNVSNETADYLVAEKQAKIMHRDKWIGLWPHSAKTGLDHKSEMKLVSKDYVPISLNSQAIHVVDCKSYSNGKPTNIWPYSILENKCTPITFEEATWFMNENEINILRSQNG